MISVLFEWMLRCIVCSEGIGSESAEKAFPLCQACHETLFPCPILCPECGGPACRAGGAIEPNCKRPWVRSDGIDSFSGLYLLLNSEFKVLRKWKTQGGLAFDRCVLISNPQLKKTWQEFQPQAVIPIPQHFGRAWKLRGSPAERISNWVSAELGIPTLQALHPPSFSISGHVSRQTSRSVVERFETPIRFSLRSSFQKSPLKRVILVDDFMTTGRTLTQAAVLLKSAGVEQIQAFCLGVRAPV